LSSSSSSGEDYNNDIEKDAIDKGKLIQNENLLVPTKTTTGHDYRKSKKF